GELLGRDVATLAGWRRCLAQRLGDELAVVTALAVGVELRLGGGDAGEQHGSGQHEYEPGDRTHGRPPLCAPPGGASPFDTTPSRVFGPGWRPPRRTPWGSP